MFALEISSLPDVHLLAVYIILVAVTVHTVCKILKWLWKDLWKGAP